MTPLMEQILVGLFVAAATLYVVWNVLLPRRMRRTLKQSVGNGEAAKTDCGDDCNCGS